MHISHEVEEVKAKTIRMASEMLIAANCEVVEAKDGREGVKLACATPFRSHSDGHQNAAAKRLGRGPRH